MTWHRTWLIQCNATDCGTAALPPNPQSPDQMPEGWVTDGTQHLCTECVAKQAEQQQQAENTSENTAEAEPVAVQ